MRAAFCLLVSAVVLAAQDDPATARLEREMARISKIAGGVVGAAAIHIETGRRVTLNPNERFPMASTVKVPLAVQLLTLVDEGKERLDRMVTLEQKDLHPGSGTLTDLFNQPGVSLSIRNLLELMLLISDNSATDVLLKVAGGPQAVNDRLAKLGIRGIRVDRPTVLLIADAAAVTLPPEEQWTPPVFAGALRASPAEARTEARKKFQDDPRDTATPDGMAQLLMGIHRKDLLKRETAELLLDIMRRCRTGAARIKGILPEGTPVAHKTGSMPMVTNDVGILTLPDHAGHVALAVFVKKSEREAAQVERGIAETARAVHDFFLFHPKGPLDFDKMAERIVTALKPQRGERFYMRPDPGYFEGLLPTLRQRMEQAGAVETNVLAEASIYMALPMGPASPGRFPQEAAALRKWTDQGGARRQLHFHWREGSVFSDGLYGEHSAALDGLYQEALDIDYQGLSARQDRVIAQLRSGVVRVRTPSGTDIRFRVGDRPFNKQDGDASADRARAARIRIDRDIELPSGVVRVAPLEESVDGTVVIPEGRFAGQTAKNVRLVFKRGKMIKHEAAENLAAVEQMLKSGGDAAGSFREFAIGLHPKLRPQPGVRVLPYYGYGEGVVRLSLGDNEELGGNVRGGFVRWFFFPDAQVDVNGRPLAIN